MHIQWIMGHHRVGSYCLWSPTIMRLVGFKRMSRAVLDSVVQPHSSTITVWILGAFPHTSVHSRSNLPVLAMVHKIMFEFPRISDWHSSATCCTCVRPVRATRSAQSFNMWGYWHFWKSPSLYFCDRMYAARCVYCGDRMYAVHARFQHGLLQRMKLPLSADRHCRSRRLSVSSWAALCILELKLLIFSTARYAGCRCILGPSKCFFAVSPMRDSLPVKNLKKLAHCY